MQTDSSSCVNWSAYTAQETTSTESDEVVLASDCNFKELKKIARKRFGWHSFNPTGRSVV